MKISVVLFIAAIIFLVIAIIFSINPIDYESKTVPCYDNHDNIINGASCQEQTSQIVSFLFLAFVICSLFGAFMLYIEDDKSWERWENRRMGVGDLNGEKKEKRNKL